MGRTIYEGVSTLDFEGQIGVRQADKVRENSMCKAGFVLAKVRAKGGSEGQDIFRAELWERSLWLLQ